MRFRLLWRVSSVLGVLTILELAITPVLAQSDKDDIHIQAMAEFYALHKYPGLRSHKAIAVGPSHYWVGYYGMPSAATASKAALAQCNRLLHESKFKSLSRNNCVLFEVDGKRTGKASPIGIPFGTTAPGEDLPWRYGKEWAATGSTKRGTMLLLHGCTGFHLDGWQMAWVNYYRAAGFRVILPNSFADARELESCGSPGENGIDRQTRNLKLRIAQTLRTISGVKKKYPDEPLYLHGHSEGGWIAQALGEKVEGIIVTGSPCGFGFSLAYHVAKGVPLLVIAGTKDYAFPQATSSKALRRFCREVAGIGKPNWVSVAGMGHYAAIWLPEVEAAISKFLRIPSVKISRRAPKEHVPFPHLTERQMNDYQVAPEPKAIAANKAGIWKWSVGLKNQLDTEETALFDCDIAAGADAYLDPSHMHGCTLVDVNGKRLVK